jgi:anti-repressor protein
MDFAISLDFAKHIAMMARTEKSHEYRNYFIACEQKIKELRKPTCIEDVLISSLQEMKALKNEVQAIKESTQETKEELQGIRDAVTLEPNQWRKDTATLINKIANKLGGFEHIEPIRKEAYKILNNSYGVDINRRLLNKKRNMALEGCSKSKINNTNYLDVIAEDKKLINGYISIIAKLAIKHGIKEVQA